MLVRLLEICRIQVSHHAVQAPGKLPDHSLALFPFCWGTAICSLTFSTYPMLYTFFTPHGVAPLWIALAAANCQAISVTHHVLKFSCSLGFHVVRLPHHCGADFIKSRPPAICWVAVSQLWRHMRNALFMSATSSYRSALAASLACALLLFPLPFLRGALGGATC